MLPPFGGLAFAALATAALIESPPTASAAPRSKKRNPKRQAQKAQRAARKKTRRNG